MYGPEVTKNSNGVVRTQSLFLELSYNDPVNAVFTLKDEDYETKGKGYTSLSKLYVSMVPSDPTEYTFAQIVFGSWSIWEAIRKSPLIIEHYTRWKREAEVKIKSQAIQAIALEMSEGGRSSFSAAKLLLDRGWIEKTTATRAAKKAYELAMDNEALQLLGEDAERLGLKVN